MRITLDLPDWAQERHIFIMAGIELLAYKLYGEEVIQVKKVRCNLCGACCMNLNKHCPLPINADGNCLYLAGELGGKRECTLGLERPYSCSIGMHRRGRTPNCCIEYATRELND